MGAVLFYIVIWLCWGLVFLAEYGHGSLSYVEVSEGKVSIEGTFAIARTDDNFVCATLDWWPPEKCDYGTCSWDHASLLNLNLSNPILVNAVNELSPLRIRLGGTLQDNVIYHTGDLTRPCNPFVKNTTEMFGFTQGCLPQHRWDQLNEFFNKAGAEVVFGLNALNGRVPMPDGSLGGPWNYSNAESLIRYTVNRGYSIYGWELGNELSGRGVRARVDADQYAADVITLKSLIDDIYKDSQSKPLVIAPGGLFDAKWYTELIQKTKSNYSLDVITHHIYNLGPGVDEHLISKILDPSYLDRVKPIFIDLQKILRSERTSTVAWVGEAGGAYNSGHNLVSNAFVNSFWYLDQLGMTSIYDTKSYCRQSLIGGNYGLLNITSFIPNPDYYSALLWHRLMGAKVLSRTFNGTNKIRAYAHCAKGSQGITLLLINLGNATVQVLATEKNTGLMSDHLHLPRRTTGITREEYHLTAKNGDLQSQTMLLNGNILEVDSDGNIPSLDPMEVDTSLPINVGPFSIVFALIRHFHAPACLYI